ncbi:MAG: hypothetical protein A2W23_04675 [Planctomycetes bacterium RBG_16_43_13]|nr:MAG: hypothetical protein A2W23_04675 [Planctomycetes bacterium RBG_16_43_13]
MVLMLVPFSFMVFCEEAKVDADLDKIKDTSNIPAKEKTDLKKVVSKEYSVPENTIRIMFYRESGVAGYKDEEVGIERGDKCVGIVFTTIRGLSFEYNTKKKEIVKKGVFVDDYTPSDDTAKKLFKKVALDTSKNKNRVPVGGSLGKEEKTGKDIAVVDYEDGIPRKDPCFCRGHKSIVFDATTLEKIREEDEHEHKKH